MPASAPPKSLRSSASGRLLLFLGGLVVGLLLAEVLARVCNPLGGADLLFNSPDASPMGLYLTDPELVMAPAPGFSGNATSLGYSVALRINQLGLRGPEVSATAEGPRWLALGDSFTLSVQVPEEQTFQALLAEQVGGEVWNGGVDGYSTWQATRRYQRLEPRLSPDGVLLTLFLGNDLQDNLHFPHQERMARTMPPGRPIPRQPVAPTVAFLLRHSHLFGQLRVLRRAWTLRSGDDPDRERWRDELSIFSSEGAGRLQELMPVTERALQELQRRVESRGDRLLVAVAPPAFVIHDERLDSTFEVVGLDPALADPSAPGRAVLAVLQKLGIAACDLQPALEAAADGGDALYFTWDGHWTPEGHRVVADALVACLETR